MLRDEIAVVICYKVRKDSIATADFYVVFMLRRTQYVCILVGCSLYIYVIRTVRK
jgi:hypothetical protein